jgi:pimeloyl-ACP methyl ester carboxylesterase
LGANPSEPENVIVETIETTIELEGRTIMYDVTGDGPPIVFVHGVWATGGVWYPVIDELAPRFRCINIHLPLGVHRYPSPRNVDHSPQALARVVAGLLDALDLHDVTLVGNDTGGAICQLVIANHRERIGRLVLTNCDAFEVFPPKVLAPLYRAAKNPALWWAFSQLGRLPRFRKRFAATVSHAAPDPQTLEMLMMRFATNADVREDLRLTICAIAPSVTLEAAKRFASFDRDVLVLWGTDDRFFPVSLARRLVAAFPRARLHLVEKAMLFVGIDAPHEVATAVAAFAEMQRVA